MDKSTENFNSRYSEYLSLIESGLAAYFESFTPALSGLAESMKYSLLSGGKRIRPVVLLEFARLCGAGLYQALPFACAVEMIHTYSLIHDDLPCMDNDSVRRGKPTNHIEFGEARAVLAGDALLNAAFETMFTADSLPPQILMEAARVIAAASGPHGMIGGQILDMENENSEADTDRIRLTYSLKTGALFRASCEAGCVIGGACNELRLAALGFAEAVGLAFQIVDDVLNVVGSEAEIGKPINSDKVRGKMTFVEAYGIEKCKSIIGDLTAKAQGFLAPFNDSSFLIQLSDLLVTRRF